MVRKSARGRISGADKRRNETLFLEALKVFDCTPIQNKLQNINIFTVFLITNATYDDSSTLRLSFLWNFTYNSAEVMAIFHVRNKNREKNMQISHCENSF